MYNIWKYIKGVALNLYTSDLYVIIHIIKIINIKSIYDTKNENKCKIYEVGVILFKNIL
jgi:hypothetical protein